MEQIHGDSSTGGVSTNEGGSLKVEKNNVVDECVNRVHAGQPVPSMDESERGCEVPEGTVDADDSVEEAEGGDGAEGDVCEGEEGEPVDTVEPADGNVCDGMVLSLQEK